MYSTESWREGERDDDDDDEGSIRQQRRYTVVPIVQRIRRMLRQTIVVEIRKFGIYDKIELLSLVCMFPRAREREKERKKERRGRREGKKMENKGVFASEFDTVWVGGGNGEQTKRKVKMKRHWVANGEYHWNTLKSGRTRRERQNDG